LAGVAEVITWIVDGDRILGVVARAILARSGKATITDCVQIAGGSRTMWWRQ
jgi:hypothetical protein